MKVVIMGCGRVGARSRELLERRPRSNHAWMSARTPSAGCPPEFKGKRHVGNGIDQDVLARIGLGEADAFIAATQGDNRNVMATQMAKHIFGVPRTLCRIYDPIREEMYRELGLETISPTLIGANLLEPRTLAPRSTRPDVHGRPGYAPSHDVRDHRRRREGRLLPRQRAARVAAHEVLVIEQDAAKCERIAEELGDIVLRGDGCEAATTEVAGFGRADMVIAVTGDDEDNLVVCQLAKTKFNVPRTIARLNNPKNEEIFRKLGIDTTVSATARDPRADRAGAADPRRHPAAPIAGGGLEIVGLKVPPTAGVVGKRIERPAAAARLADRAHRVAGRHGARPDARDDDPRGGRGRGRDAPENEDSLRTILTRA